MSESSSSPPAGQADSTALPGIDSLEELVDFIRDHPGVLLRYSRGPEQDARSGPSRDYEAGVDLPGLSATTVEPEPWWPRPAADWVARRVCKYLELGQDGERYPWLLTGEVVGQGPDHEPIVVGIRPLARIGPRALQEAKERYETRFEVGNDSR